MTALYAALPFQGVLFFPAGCRLLVGAPNPQWQQPKHFSWTTSFPQPADRTCLLLLSVLQWQQAKQFFVDNFLEHAKEEGLEDCCWLHLVKESR